MQQTFMTFHCLMAFATLYVQGAICDWRKIHTMEEV